MRIIARIFIGIIAAPLVFMALVLAAFILGLFFLFCFAAMIAAVLVGYVMIVLNPDTSIEKLLGKLSAKIDGADNENEASVTSIRRTSK